MRQGSRLLLWPASFLVRCLSIGGAVLLLCLTILGTPSQASSAGPSPSSPPARRFAGLEQAARARALGPRVLRELRGRGWADALVVFDGSAPLAEAVRGVPPGGGRGTAVLRTTRPAYTAEKSRVLSALHGVSVVRDYSALPVSFVRFRSARSALAALNDPEVVGIAADGRRRMDLAQSLPLIRQPVAAAAGYIGAGTSVAVVDTGVDYTRSAFGSCSSPGTPAGCRVAFAQDFAPNDGSLDDNGHGTNVAGIVAGVAPDTQILSLDVFSGPTAYDSNILAAINWIVSNQATYNIRAMNLSLGAYYTHFTSECADPTNPYVSAFANARAVGVMPVVAAGNTAYDSGTFVDGVSSPACTPGAMRVGAVYDSNVGSGLTWGDARSRCTDATTTADQITCFSQDGAILTVLAPGAMITAAGLTYGGTSQAAPHVAGAVAVLAAASPGASLDAISSAIANSGPAIIDARDGVTRHRFDLPSAVAALAPPTAGADLSIAVTDSPDPASVGGTITYTLTVTNNGPSSAAGVAVSDPLPATVTFVSASSGCTGTATVSCPVGTLASGAAASVQIVVTATSAGTVANTATVTASTSDPNGANNSATDSTTVGSAPGCTITGTAGNDVLQGTAGPDVICGLGGNDILQGGGGDDILIGGPGFDYAYYSDATSGVTVDLTAGTATGGAGNDVLQEIEGVVGSPFADTITGDGGVNRLYGQNGSDRLVGLGMDDRLSGGPGNDYLDGGAGNDTLRGGPGLDTCIQGPGSGTQAGCER